jgi:hypothetical protein
MKYRARQYLIAALLIVFGLMLGVMLGLSKDLVMQNGVVAAEVPVTVAPAVTAEHTQVTTPPSLSPETPPAASEMELKIASTLRNCLGAYCYDSKPEGSAVNRVALLAPPDAGGDILFAALQPLLAHDASEVELVHSTHVPPYGYGKNHGWNAIIRLYRPVQKHALSMVTARASEVMFAKQTRQLVRWHCRLSHVAAHTRTLTVHMDALLASPALELDRIITFIVGKKGGKYPRERMLIAAPALVLHLSAAFAEQGAGAGVGVPSHLQQVGEAAMSSEYDATNGLSKW